MHDTSKARSSHDAAARQWSRQKLEHYLAIMMPLEDVENLVAWWSPCESISLVFLLIATQKKFLQSIARVPSGLAFFLRSVLLF